MLYLYALVDSAAALPDDVELVSIDGIGAVVGEIDDVVDPTDEQVLSHARVVDQVAALNDAVLPVRLTVKTAGSDICGIPSQGGTSGISVASASVATTVTTGAGGTSIT